MKKQDKMDEQWLDEIRQTLADHEEELPADGWEKLAAALSSAEKAVPAAPASRPRLVPVWLLRAAAVLLMVAIGIGGMYYFSDSPEISTTSITSDVKESLHVEEYSAGEESFEQEQRTAKSKSPSTKQVLAMTSASEQQILEQQIEKEEPDIQKEPTDIESQQLIPDPSSDIHQEEAAVLLAMENSSARNQVASRSWTLGMRLGRNGSGDFDFGDQKDFMNSSDGFGSPSSGTDGYDYPVGDPSSADSTRQNSLTRAQTRAADETATDDVVDSEHHLSWSAGISVGKQLNRYLSLESGLVYTYLSSDVTLKQSGHQHQQLHYLGIPLKLSAIIAEEGRWRFYANIGTMLEHSLYGRRGQKNLHLNDWQWSMDGGIGLQYKLTEHMGLYIEPGVNYYFSNGSEVPSLRTESPFTFNLQIGVRFGL